METLSIATLAFIAIGVLILIWILDTLFRMPFTLKKTNFGSLILAAAVVGMLVATYGLTAAGWQDWHIYMVAILLLILAILWHVLKTLWKGRGKGGD